MKSKVKAFLLMLLLFPVMIAQGAEPMTVKGTVTDSNGEPLTGVSVLVVGTASGTQTNIDGEFQLKASVGDVLRLTYIGYATQEIKISGSQPLNVVMKEDAMSLDEVVVTALGIKRAEKALSYNVQKVDGSVLTGVKDANFVNSLNGVVAGVNINKSSAGVGGSTRVVMRGVKSIEGDNNALYVIDGIPMFNTTMGGNDSGVMGESRAGSEAIADLNPEDIESISVLSGPSAAALYGSSAANGVILVNTKKGTEGKFSVTVSSSSLFSKAYRTPRFQNTYGNQVGSYESWGSRLAAPSNYDPKNDFFNTGTNFINGATFTAGSKINQVYASVASTNSRGIVPNNSYDRLNFTMRNSTHLLNDRLHIDLGASFINQHDRNMVSQGQYYNPVLAAYIFPRGENFQDIKTFERFDATRNINTQYWPVADGVYATQNPYWIAYRNPMTNKKRRYMFNVGVQYDITSWMNIAARYRWDDATNRFEQKIYASSDTKHTEGSSKGYYRYETFNSNQQYADVMLNINKTIADWSLNVNLGYSYSDYKDNLRGLRGPLLGVPNKFSIMNIDMSQAIPIEEGGKNSVRNNAVFGSAEIGWRSMLYLTLTGRNDWNSRLVNTGNESFFYPSVGLSAVINEMVELPRWISYLKVRGSYTEVGAPISRSGLTPGTWTTPIQGGVLQPDGIYPFTDFKAERTKSYEFGLSARFLNKIHADFTYYHSNTNNQTFLGELPEFTGYKQIYLQAGDVMNKGFEVSLGYSDTYACGLSFSTTVTYSRNINKIKKMVHDFKTPLLDDPINILEVQKDNGRVILKEGGSLSDIYANRFFKKDSQGFVEIKADGSFGMETTDPVYLGHTAPSCNLGWNNYLGWKGFSLSFLVSGRIGGVVTSSTEAILDRFGVSQATADARDAGGALLPGQGRVDANKYYTMIGTGNWETAGYYVYSATNWRLANLTFGYTFPSRWFGNVINDLTVSFIAENPWLIYCKAPFDPELTPSTGTYGQGNDYFMQPSTRSFGFGIKFKL